MDLPDESLMEVERTSAGQLDPDYYLKLVKSIEQAASEKAKTIRAKYRTDRRKQLKKGQLEDYNNMVKD